MLLYITKNESMLILIYPNQQKREVDHFLSPIDFKNPSELVGTHCIDSTIINETTSEVTVRYFKTPQLIQEVELVKLSRLTEDYFTETINLHKEFTDQSKIIQILNLYCTFDDAICACSEEDLVVTERIAIKS
ncbi:MAG: hypothetical protein PUP91_37810 [Rhizonema sp. PD37]|nr:hypothetical protein [Rhizonema sp. PD37]